MYAKIGHFFSSHRAAIVWILRIVVGAVFILSGFTKAIDPWGFIFKIEDYLGVWNVNVPRSIILVGAIGLSAYEFICGIFLATGCLKRITPYLLSASMVFMLPLTAYIMIDNPVDDCGCFGDFLKISNSATFIKNLILTAALVYLCINNRKIKQAVYAPSAQWIVATLSFIYIMAISLYGYNIQPMIDFRPYPIGTSLIADHADDAIDSDMMFTYEKNGERRDFQVDNLPDSTWTFIDRTEPDIQSLPKPLSIFDGDEDVTSDVITNDKSQLLLVVPEPERADISYTYAINLMQRRLIDDDAQLTGLLAASPEIIAQWVDLSMASYPCYTVEDTSMKELARGTISIVYLENGVIMWKRTLSSIDFDTITKLENGAIDFEDLAVDSQRSLVVRTLIWLVAMIVTALSRLIIAKMKKRM